MAIMFFEVLRLKGPMECSCQWSHFIPLLDMFRAMKHHPSGWNILIDANEREKMCQRPFSADYLVLLQSEKSKVHFNSPFSWTPLQALPSRIICSPDLCNTSKKAKATNDHSHDPLPILIGLVCLTSIIMPIPPLPWIPAPQHSTPT